MSPMILAASTQRTVGLVLAVIVMVGVVVYLLFNFRIAKREVGSEIELAANRRRYADDNELETRILDKALGWSLVTLAGIALILPLYWLMEPARQENAAYGWVKRFEGRGARSYEEACSGCHGPNGVGGVAAFTLADSDGKFVAQVQWKAPALTAVLSRFDESEVEHILNYGRPGSPMPAWGLPGGGPMTEQQIHQLVVYLRSIQLAPEKIASEVATGLRDGAKRIVVKANPVLADSERLDTEIDKWLAEASDPTSPDYLAYGGLIFNNGAAQGAYSCARCHTPGFSYGATSAEAVDSLISEWPRLAGSGILTGYQPGAGHVGPSLSGVETHFSTPERQADFIGSGSKLGVGYGNARAGTGGMPGFSSRTDDLEVIGTVVRSQILTPEQIAAVVAYERSL
ncbi:MAG: c-type cytochrome [Actinomycetota bacterium]|nr:c-type cytochrome [Actinomycetota bacterium]